jgi:hypothetical protein
MLVKFLFCCSSLLMILGSVRGDDIQTARGAKDENLHEMS